MWHKWQREPGAQTLVPLAMSVFSLLLKHPKLQRAEDVDALLLGMASQIAEREDHVVVEDVQGGSEAGPAGCELVTPGRKSCWTCRGRQGGVLRAERISDPRIMVQIFLGLVRMVWAGDCSHGPHLSLTI